jgi:hypothetical protein
MKRSPWNQSHRLLHIQRVTGLPSTYPSLYDINIEQDFVSRTFELRLYTIILPFTLSFSLSLSPQRCAHWAGNNNDKMHPPWLLLPSIEPSDPPALPLPPLASCLPFQHLIITIEYRFASSSPNRRSGRESRVGWPVNNKRPIHTHTHPGSSSISYAVENWIPGHHHLCSLCRRFPGDQGSPTCTTPLSPCITERLFFLSRK